MFHLPKRHNNIPKEPKRLFRWVHSVLTIKLILACMTFLYYVQYIIWGIGYAPHTLFQHTWQMLSLLWVTSLLPTMFGVSGLLYYSHPQKLDDQSHIYIPVCWRIVSKGTNIDSLKNTIMRIQYEMARTPLFPYIIEVVLDNPIELEYSSDVIMLVVPKEYQTPNGSRFKARALHYAAYHSSIPIDTWIVHLDEETQPTPSGIKGIAKMIQEENHKKNPPIGQGALLYHRNWNRSHFLFLADMIRTGDDFSRFHFQHSVGQTIFGLHGSFIVVRNDVEQKSGGFDFGPDGDITEDATWALHLMQKGHRSRWVEGYLEEQPCQSVIDLLKQRKRWWSGLWDTCTKTNVSWRWKGVLGMNIIAWALAPFAAIYTFAHIFVGVEVNPVVTLFANFIYASYFAMYMIGLFANMKEGLKKVSIWKKAYLTLFQMVLTLLPILSTLEAIPILWALINKDKGFHVIKK